MSSNLLRFGFTSSKYSDGEPSNKRKKDVVGSVQAGESSAQSKALTRLLLQVHMSVREQGSSKKAGKKIILGWNMMTLKMKCSVCCVEDTPRLPIAQARFFLVHRALDFKTYKYMASLRDTGNVLRQTRQQRIQTPEYTEHPQHE